MVGACARRIEIAAADLIAISDRVGYRIAEKCAIATGWVNNLWQDRQPADTQLIAAGDDRLGREELTIRAAVRCDRCLRHILSLSQTTIHILWKMWRKYTIYALS